MGGAILFVPPLLAVIFGHISISRAKDPAVGGRGLGITGLVLGYLAILGFIGWIALFGLAAFMAASNSVDLHQLDSVTHDQETLILPTEASE